MRWPNKLISSILFSMFLTKAQSVLLAQPLWLERNLFSQPQNPLIGVQPGKRPVCSGKRLVSDWAMPHLTCSQLFLEGRFPKLAKLCGTSIVACPFPWLKKVLARWGCMMFITSWLKSIRNKRLANLVRTKSLPSLTPPSLNILTNMATLAQWITSWVRCSSQYKTICPPLRIWACRNTLTIWLKRRWTLITSLKPRAGKRFLIQPKLPCPINHSRTLCRSPSRISLTVCLLAKGCAEFLPKQPSFCAAHRILARWWRLIAVKFSLALSFQQAGCMICQPLKGSQP